MSVNKHWPLQERGFGLPEHDRGIREKLSQSSYRRHQFARTSYLKAYGTSTIEGLTPELTRADEQHSINAASDSMKAFY